MKSKWYTSNPIGKKARRPNRGFPAVTVAYYGPDGSSATKAVASFVAVEGVEVSVVERFFSESLDARISPQVTAGVLKFINDHKPRSVVATPKLLGCPHEEGIDYPEGSTCPRCPYWADKNRWEGIVDDYR